MFFPLNNNKCTYIYPIDKFWSCLSETYHNGLQMSFRLLASASDFIDISLKMETKPEILKAVSLEISEKTDDYHLTLSFLHSSSPKLRLWLMKFIVDMLLNEQKFAFKKDRDHVQALEAPSVMKKMKTDPIFRMVGVRGLIPVLALDLALVPDLEPDILSPTIAVMFFLTATYIFHHDDPELGPKVAIVPESIISLLRRLHLDTKSAIAFRVALRCLNKFDARTIVKHEGLPLLVDIIKADRGRNIIAQEARSLIWELLFRWDSRTLHAAFIGCFSFGSQTEGEHIFLRDRETETIEERQSACRWLYFTLFVIPFVLCSIVGAVNFTLAAICATFSPGLILVLYSFLVAASYGIARSNDRPFTPYGLLLILTLSSYANFKIFVSKS